MKELFVQTDDSDDCGLEVGQLFPVLMIVSVTDDHLSQDDVLDTFLDTPTDTFDDRKNGLEKSGLKKVTSLRNHSFSSVS